MDAAIRMSGSSVMPAGSKRMFVNFETYVSRGTPYCRPIEIATEKASMIPASVEPCLLILRKTSPRPSSGYDDAVMYPSAPATENDVVVLGRDFGSRLRIGRYSTSVSTAFFGSSDFLPPAERGWPTLQLSRYTASALRPSFQPSA